MIANNYQYYATRQEIEKHKKVKEESAAHLTNTKKQVLYEYYVCDYCKNEIQIKKKHYEQTGGVVVIPATVTKKKEIKLTLCNCCLNKVLAEFDEKG